MGIKDVAQAAGVSLGTVSNVLNRPELVSDAMRARVQVAIDELGFVRNGSASRLRSTRSKTIGLVVLDVGNPYFTEIARGAESAAEERGYAVMLCNSDESGRREERHLSFLAEQRVGGILLTPTSPAVPETHLAALRSHGVEVVLVDEASPALDVCSVSVDDVQGGHLAGQHLLAGGRRRLVYLSGSPTIRQCADRLTGLRDAIAEFAATSDDPVELDLVDVTSMTGRAGYAATDTVLALEPDAIFAANDLLALGVLRGLLEREVKVPGDIALIGYDDIEFAGLAVIPISSVRQPAFEIGQSAVQLLLEECGDGAHAHQQVVFRPELVVRRSSDATR
ncbi:MAG: LacI family DNA-binding transcriptional regulator [Acidimicrobiales bacterium]